MKLHEAGRVELVQDRRQGRTPGRRIGVGELALVDVEVVGPLVGGQRGELGYGRRRRLRLEEIVDDDVGIGLGRPVGGRRWSMSRSRRSMSRTGDGTDVCGLGASLADRAPVGVGSGPLRDRSGISLAMSVPLMLSLHQRPGSPVESQTTASTGRFLEPSPAQCRQN